MKRTDLRGRNVTNPDEVRPPRFDLEKSSEPETESARSLEAAGRDRMALVDTVLGESDDRGPALLVALVLAVVGPAAAIIDDKVRDGDDGSPGDAVSLDLSTSARVHSQYPGGAQQYYSLKGSTRGEQAGRAVRNGGRPDGRALRYTANASRNTAPGQRLRVSERLGLLMLCGGESRRGLGATSSRASPARESPLSEPAAVTQ